MYKNCVLMLPNDKISHTLPIVPHLDNLTPSKSTKVLNYQMSTVLTFF